MLDFSKKVDEVFIDKSPKWDGIDNELYNVDIYIFRHKGMGNSKQIIIAKNKVSIMIATESYLETLLRQGIISVNELDELVDFAKELYKKN